MSPGRPSYAVAVLPPGGPGVFATFETQAAASEYASRSLPDHPASRAWILRLLDGKAELLGSRGAGQWMYDRIPHFIVAPLAGGQMTMFSTYNEAREHAGPGMVILTLEENGVVRLDEVS